MLARILYYYYQCIFLNYSLNSRDKLLKHQQKLLNRLIKNTLVHSPFYKDYLDKPFSDWPIMNKSLMNQYFDEINTVKIKKDKAFEIALNAEKTRNFSPLINNIAVGLSSGTSGERGLFLTSPYERDAWAGIILAKVLPHGLHSKERIAFFLRANNPLYSTINKSKSIEFNFFDLLDCFDKQINQLNKLQPTILSAPSSVLCLLAKEKHRLSINPKRIIAVAEVLEKTAEEQISQAFNLPISQVYQCTEGFLAASHKTNNKLIMNEEFLIIEKEWIDEQRFVPVITDLMRTTQPIVRYRLDDILIANQANSIFTELKAIEGRLGDVCYGKNNETIQPIFADSLRQGMASSPIDFEDYFICQNSLQEFSIQVMPYPSEPKILTDHLNQIFIQKGCEIPCWNWQTYIKKNEIYKLRRIQSKIRFEDCLSGKYL